MPLPVTLGTAAATGGAIGTVPGILEETSDKGWTPDAVKSGAAKGFVGGMAGAALGHGFVEAIRPWATPGAQALIQAGVPLTPGQTMGGVAQTVENIIRSAPGVGAFVRGAENTATEGLNRVVANRALEPIGMQLGPDIAPGHASVDHVFQTLGDAYDALLPHIQVNRGEFAPGSSWERNLANVIDDARLNGIDEDAGIDQIQRAINSVNVRLQNGVPPNGQHVPGEVIKRIESSLSERARSLRRSTDADANQAAAYVDRIRDELRLVVERTNPQEAARLQAINSGYGIAAIMRRAANLGGNADGIFTAAQLSRAVRQQDPSVSKTSFARGVARLQDISAPAAPAMRTLADSGTPERALTLGAIGAGATMHVNPGLLTAAAAVPVLYNPVAKAMFRAAATRAPQTRNAIADAMQADLPVYVTPGLGVAQVRSPDRTMPRNSLLFGGR